MMDRAAHEKRVQWFQEARLGMFIHWGLYAIPARGEWVKSIERIPDARYQRYFEDFDPVDFDPRAWARAARDAGMRYAVLTAKHHDGFCLFDSRFTDYKATNTRAGRDIVRDFLDAFRAEGLRVGLYYSLLDWHHPDYPHFGDDHHPMRGDPAHGNEGRDFSRYLDYLRNQVEELCTNYGRLDILWFDFSYGELRGDAWRATELTRLIRRLQPNVLLDNRMEVSGEGFGSLLTDAPSDFCGDFVSPEQIIPPEGIRDAQGRPVPWETNVTMNNHWGYCADDRFFKPAPMLVRKLVECVSKGGNFLVNVGPDARGRIPPESLAILGEMGGWMRRNGRSVYGCGAAGIPKPDFGRVTRRGDRVFYHVTDAPIGFVPLTGLARERIAGASLLATGAELPIEDNWITGNYPDLAFVSLGQNPVPPDETDTVIEVRLKAE